MTRVLLNQKGIINSKDLEDRITRLGFKVIKVFCNKSSVCILIDSHLKISANDCQIVAEYIRSTFCLTNLGIRNIEVSSTDCRIKQHAVLRRLCGIGCLPPVSSVRFFGLRQTGILRSLENTNRPQLLQLFDNQTGSIVLSHLTLNLVSLKLMNVSFRALGLYEQNN